MTKSQRRTPSVLILLTFLFLVASLGNDLHANNGKAQFQLCVYCHGPNGEGKQEIAAPGIAGLPVWYVQRQLENFKNDIRGKHPDDIPGHRMRPMAKTLMKDEDLKDVSVYVSKLPPVAPPVTITTGNAETGKNFYAVCTACHGQKGEGNKALNSPPLTHINDWYFVSQIHSYKSKMRGANAAKDPVGATMAPMANTLADDQAIYDVIAYIRTFLKK